MWCIFQGLYALRAHLQPSLLRFWQFLLSADPGSCRHLHAAAAVFAETWLCLVPQIQAAAAICMLTVLVIFVAVTFEAPLPKPLPSYLAATYTGYASIAVMPISLASSTVFSEAMWQRCWATSTKRWADRRFRCFDLAPLEDMPKLPAQPNLPSA